ncbi:conserved hypothetical protein [Ricinus communis]|uniref:Uncharacterized protein n=1 Tax=Ricinus communis TaxID=3988 RepID=B9T356_RICCO|nr:conserved hypothetical protein [Ricinus communis]
MTPKSLVKDSTPTGTSTQTGSPSALEREGLVRKALGREDSKGDCSTGDCGG